jgi:hypothetical protein
VCDLETLKDEAKSPLKGCEYKPTMGCDAERERKKWLYDLKSKIPVLIAK